MSKLIKSGDEARKALEAGVDGLVLVAAGAGGHTGPVAGFAFVEEVRRFFAGPLVLGGGIGSGRAIRASRSSAPISRISARVSSPPRRAWSRRSRNAWWWPPAARISCARTRSPA